ncbi:GNAT family N-acetyltransferase [Herpetosiphon gulosus]|uniref:GNAT family N-acetyltransferase n=1 Tax=Herpetosiphon gulosus TaxID=1973496 RepID=A0ABP9X9B7_9CHLR
MHEANNDLGNEYIIGPLEQRHDRAAFSCESEPLNDYLKTFARQNDSKRVSKVYVATRQGDKAICGFYTLSAHQVEIPRFPEDMQRKLPKYTHLPALLLGRLARDSSHRGKGLGGLLLGDAIIMFVLTSSIVGAAALVVDAKDENAKKFYAENGFLTFADNPMQLYMTFQKAKSYMPAGAMPTFSKEDIRWK